MDPQPEAPRNSLSDPSELATISTTASTPDPSERPATGEAPVTSFASAEFSTPVLPAEVALSHSRDRYRSLVQATAQIVWTNDAAGQMMGEQPSWGAFTGQSQEQYQYHGWSGAVHPEDRELTIRRWQQAVATRTLFEVEHRVRRHDGIYRHFSVRGVPVLEADGTIREWVGVHTDITPQREIIESLQESEERYRLLSDTLPVQVWTAYPSGKLDYVNDFTCQYVGRSPQEIMAEGWQKVVHPADLPLASQTWRQCLEGGQPYLVEIRLQRAADRAYRWHTARAVPLRDKAGQVIKWIGTNADIDDQKRSAEIKEAALHQVKMERQRLLTIFMQAPMAMALYQGPEYTITMVNALWEEFTGKHNVLYKKVREVFPEVEQQGLLQLLDQVYETRQVFQANQMRILLDRAGDGTLEETFWDVVVQPLSEKSEGATDLLTYGMEVTQQVRAQQAITSLHAQLDKAGLSG